MEWGCINLKCPRQEISRLAVDWKGNVLVWSGSELIVNGDWEVKGIRNSDEGVFVRFECLAEDRLKT